MNIDIKLLRMRVTKFSADTRASRNKVYVKLLNAGWCRDLLVQELDAALRWANSTVLVAKQKEERERRKLVCISNDNALESMFAAMGVAKEDIIKGATE